MEDEVFRFTLNEINRLSPEGKKHLEEYLTEMEMEELTTIKDYQNYIKNNYDSILEVTFGTRNKNTLAHQCRYIIEVERHCEWAVAVTGRTTPTFFGWFEY